MELGVRIRDLYAIDASDHERIKTSVDDDYVATLARALTGELGGKVGVVPRVFAKKLVADILDRVDLYDEFDPRQHYALTVTDNELTAVERNARAAEGVDDIDLDV